MRWAFTVLLGALLSVSLSGGGTPARAHNGPPYPILVDHPASPYDVSVWADPDVGVGTFYVVLAPQPGTAFLAPEGVEVVVQPASRRLKEARYQAVRQDAEDATKYLVQVPFDKAGSWRVRVLMRGPQGRVEVAKMVEVTPDDLGRLGLLVYLFPFAAIGALWLKGMARERRRRDARQATAQATGQATARGGARAAPAADPTADQGDLGR